MKRYRANHRRIDYVPGAKAQAVISGRLRASTDSISAVIDALVMAGGQAVTGNSNYLK